MAATAAHSQPGPWVRELDNFVRAFSGAFLFGTPLLFTMEMWWIGTYIDPLRLAGFVLLALAANMGLAYFAGFKRRTGLPIALGQSVDAFATGIVASTLVLVVLQRITLDQSFEVIASKILLQAVPLSIGASVANAVFVDGSGRAGEEQSGSALHRAANDFGATMAGAIFIGFSIAPTEEVPMLGAGMDNLHIAALAVLSLLVTYGIVFESGFSPQDKRRGGGGGLFQHPLSETAMAYILSLLVAFTVLVLFEHISIGDPFWGTLNEVIVLGFPAAVGGAAGRVVI